MAKRQISKEDKLKVIDLQKGTDGLLRCYISGEIIDIEKGQFEFDHIVPFSANGATEISNIRVYKKEYNREKKSMSLEEYREYFALKRNFEAKQNKVKLQDIFMHKGIVSKMVSSNLNSNDTITIEDGSLSKTFELLKDNKLDVNYFYGRIPLSWIENDDQQGLQPRVIDFTRLIQIKRHLESYPQLAPSIARMINNKIKLFDGQHKLAAQALNGQTEVDVKIYLSPLDDTKAKDVYEKLLKTNLEAHSKLAQMSFSTSTLFQKFEEMQDIRLGEFVEQSPGVVHSEENFLKYTIQVKKLEKAEAKRQFDASIIKSVLDESPLKEYTAESNKDSSLPLSYDLLKKTIFKHCLYLSPSSAELGSPEDYRESESENFALISQMLIEEGFLSDWKPSKTDTDPKVIKARRIWTKAAVLTWSTHLETIINMTFSLFSSAEQKKNLYRGVMDDTQKNRLRMFLKRLFNHPIWMQADPTLDKAFAAASSMSEIFEAQGLNQNYLQSWT